MSLLERIKEKYLRGSSPFKGITGRALSRIIRDMPVPFERWDLVNQEIKRGVYKDLEEVMGYPTSVNFKLKRKNFENFLCNYFNGDYCVGTGSGTSALYLALTALGIGEGDEVITTPYTYISTALSIARTGAKPVFADIDEKYSIDASKVEEKITDNTEAILPVHLYGNLSDMDMIIHIADSYDLNVVEDCSQAHTSTYNGDSLPYGDIGCFSFHTSKLVGGMGNAGAIVTDNHNLLEKIKDFVDPWSEGENSKKLTPSYIDAIQSIFIKAKLKRGDKWTEKRRKIAKIYSDNLKDVVKTPEEREGSKHSYFRYSIEAKERDRLQKRLLVKGIESRRDYQTPIHLTDAFKDLSYKKGDFPRAEKASKGILCLPCHQFMGEKDAYKVIKEVRSFYS